MKRLAIVIAVLGFLGGLTSCGDPGEAEPSSGGFASCTDLLYVKGQVFDTWFLRNKLKRGRVGSPATAIEKDCADTGGTPASDREVPVRRIAVFRSARRSTGRALVTGTSSTLPGTPPHRGSNSHGRRSLVKHP